MHLFKSIKKEVPHCNYNEHVADMRRGFSFTDFHRGANEMYLRGTYHCAKCEDNFTVCIELPQDFTDRCDMTYPWPWHAPHEGRENISFTKLKYRIGNLVTDARDGKVKAFAHQANCFNSMTGGIALAFSQEVPPLRVADNNTINGDHDKLGTFSSAVVNDQGTVGYNLYGQYHPGPATDTTKLRKSLKAMKVDLMGRGIKEISLPKIGCGIGGGDWQEIETMIADELTPALNVVIVVQSEDDIPIWRKHETI